MGVGAQKRGDILHKEGSPHFRHLQKNRTHTGTSQRTLIHQYTHIKNTHQNLLHKHTRENTLYLSPTTFL